jgi:hypothetical protein
VKVVDGARRAGEEIADAKDLMRGSPGSDIEEPGRSSGAGAGSDYFGPGRNTRADDLG